MDGYKNDLNLFKLHFNRCTVESYKGNKIDSIVT